MATVIEDIANRRFEMPIDGEAVAVAYYRQEGDRVTLIHTEVPNEFSGQGVATRLAAGTFDLIRRSDRKAVLQCPFMGRFFVTHPDYADIVAG